MRSLTVLFAIFLVFVVFAANLGLAGALFGILYSFPNGDKLGHFLLFGLLALLAALGFSLSRARLGFWRPLNSALLIALVVTLEELSQIFLANRSFDLIDLLASFAGIFLFSEIGARLRRNPQPPVQSR